jgi:hypothetical protein
MTSYNLIKHTHLGDLEDHVKSRLNLEIGPLQTMNSNDVFFTNGNISVFDCRLKSAFSTSDKYSFITSSDEKGTFKWNTDDDYYIWYYANDIYLSGFYHDNYFVEGNLLSNLAFDNMYDSLSNQPTTSDFIPVECNVLFLDSTCNLGDINSTDAFTNLELGNLSYQPVNGFTDFEFVNITNHIRYSENAVSNITGYNSNEINFFTSEFKLLRGSLYTNELIFDNIFYNEDKSVKALYSLINSYKIQNSVQSVTSAALSNMYVNIRGIINDGDFQTEESKRILLERIQSGYFLVTNSNLLDVSDITISKINIGVGDLTDQYSNLVQMDNLIVKETFTVCNLYNEYIPNDIPFDGVRLIHAGSNSNIILSEQFLSATEQVSGFVRWAHDDTSNYSSNSVKSWSYLKNEEYNFKNQLPNIQEATLTSYDQYINTEFTFLTKTLNEFNGYSGLSNVHSNLELHAICTSKSYTDLQNTPLYISVFKNDRGILEINNNLSDVNVVQALKTLDILDYGLQDNNNVNIEDGTVILNHLLVKNMLNFPNSNPEISVTGKWLGYASNIDNLNLVTHIDLPVATVNTLGVVKITSNYNSTGYDTVVTKSGIDNMLIELEDRLDNIKSSYPRFFPNNIFRN